MSDALSRTEFENLMDEYLRNELSEPGKKSFEQYLGRNPEAQAELKAARAILEITAQAATADPPEELVARAVSDFQKSFKKSNEKDHKKSGVVRFFRPAMIWGVAASLILAVGVTIWPSNSTLVFAQVIASLREVESIQVEGWVRGENGVVIPYRQWLLADGTLRAEIGKKGDRRVVVAKGEERVVKDRDGRLFLDRTPFKLHEDLGTALRGLQATYESPQVVRNSFEFAKEDLGDVVRFTRREKAILGNGPSNRRWVLEVDKESALPVVSQLHQKIDGSWVQITDLRYTDFNGNPAMDMFELGGTRLPMSDADKQRFWFELYISPSSIQTPAVHVPVGGLQVYWPTADEMPAGMNSGGSTYPRAGITTHELLNLPLSTVVPAITGQRVVQNSVAEQKVSLKISAKTVLPWRVKLEPVLEKLGLSYEVKERETTRKRWIFNQDGKDIPPSGHRFQSYSVSAVASANYTYKFERIGLHQVVTALMGNCSGREEYAPGDTLIFQRDGDETQNPFKKEVDLDFVNPEATLNSNLEFLKERFGINVEVKEEVVEIREIELFEK